MNDSDKSGAKAVRTVRFGPRVVATLLDALFLGVLSFALGFYGIINFLDFLS